MLRVGNRGRSGAGVRKRYLRIATAVAMCLPAVVAAQDLTFVSWGGAYTRSQMLAFVLPYEEKTGKRVDVLDYAGGLDQIRSQVRSLNVKWDVVDLEPTDAIRGCEEGLLARIDPARLEPAPDGTAPRKDFIDGSLMDCAVGTVVWSTVIAYDETAFDGPAPETVEDFFDIQRFPGARGLRRTPKANLEWALLADGVPAGKIYDVLETREGVRRALSVLDRIKPHVVWWEDGEQPPRLLETGRVVMTSAYNGRIYDAAVRRGLPLRIIWDKQIWSFDLLGIPVHSRRKERALDFIRFATSSHRLAEQAGHIPYGPVRRSSLARVEESIRPYLPTARDNFRNAVQIDPEWWAEHYERISVIFEQWLERPVRVPRALPH